MIAIIFHPLGLPPFIQCPMSDLYNRYIDIEDLEDIELNHLKNAISSERNVQTCIEFIELFLMKRLIDIDYNHKRVQNSISQIIYLKSPQIESMSKLALITAYTDLY